MVKKAKITDKRIEKIARKVAYKQIPRKMKTYDGTDSQTLTAAAPWLVIRPTLIPRVNSANVDGNFHRNSDNIYGERCSGYFNLSLFPQTTNRVEVRELVGWYKGSIDASRKSVFQFGVSELEADLPNKMSRWDADNYKIIHDKSYDLMPAQVYNTATGDGTNSPNGIWRSKMIKLNLPMYRRFNFTNTTEGGAGDTVSGGISASQVPMGWQPFIAVQVRCPDQAFTGTRGSNPSPTIDYKFTTYFKELQ